MPAFRFWRRRHQDVAPAHIELSPITRSQHFSDGRGVDDKPPLHDGDNRGVGSVKSLVHKRSQGFFGLGTRDLPDWRDSPPSPTTKNVIDSAPHLYSHRELHDLLNEHPSFQRAQILSTEIYTKDEGAMSYNSLIVGLQIGLIKFSAHLDGRRIGKESEADPFGVSGNVVSLTADQSSLGLDDLTKLNKQRFKDPPTMHSLVRLLDAVHEETAARHSIDSRLLCSLLQRHLGAKYSGAFEEGESILPSLSRSLGRALDKKLSRVVYFQPPIPPLSDLLFSMVGEPDELDPKYEAFQLSLELDVSRNFQVKDRRELAAKLGTALRDLAVQNPVAEHPKVSYVWEHIVMLFRAINRYDEEHSIDLARSLHRYGCSLRDGRQYEGAIIVFRDAMHILERLYNEDPHTYRLYLASVSSSYTDALIQSEAGNIPPSLLTNLPRLVMSIEIGCQHSSVAVAYCQTGKLLLHEPVQGWPGQNQPRVPSVVKYNSKGEVGLQVVECGGLGAGANLPGGFHSNRSQNRARRIASRTPPSKLYSDYLKFLISHARHYLNTRAGHDSWSLVEKYGDVVLSHADAECDQMQSLLREATKSAGLSRVHILDKTQTAALIALSKNTHVTPTVGSTILLCDGGPTSIEVTVYTVVSCAGGHTSLEKLRSSVLEGGAQTVNESFMMYFRDNEGWKEFSKDDIDYWMQNAVQHFEQHGRRNFKTVADACKVELQSRRLNNNHLAIKKGVMHIEGEQAAKFFEPLIQTLVGGIKKMRRKQTSIIILQGELSDMPYVRDTLQKRIGSPTTNVTYVTGCSSNVGDIALGALDIVMDDKTPPPRPTKRKWLQHRGGSGITCNITEILT